MAESSKKRSRDTRRFGSEAADLAYHERFQSRTFVIESKFFESEFEEPEFAFILQIFESRGWESLLLRRHLAYPRIVREFYANIHKIKMDPPSFETYVREAKIVVNAELLSEVAEIPLVLEPGYPFGNPELPSKDTMMTKFTSADGPSCFLNSLAELSQPPKRLLPQAHKVPAPAAGCDTGGASSSVSMSSLMEQVKALIRMMGNMEKRVKNIDERTAKMEKRQEPRGEHFEQHLAAGGNQTKEKKSAESDSV
ncbi:hypothetical protein FH972_000815 [Carpinus fangiana]|uniref:Uncharacterized protein n=1 Tax=Carpinus fangiana TaxID=176857 RepID=A0A5N6QA30_9ROSI|nr:hypothetical protein FH972_000815 [Carpinus fangiana]